MKISQTQLLRNIKSLYIALTALVLSSCTTQQLPQQVKPELPNGISFIEKITASDNQQIVIPYEKYLLDNGLTVILHQDNSDPLVHVDITYHVGSAREEIGKSGFAHFFEHMQFQGSENVADEEHFKIISESGGTLNGTTNRDRTNYYETVPSNQLEKVLWLESDRMGYFLDAVTQEKFEVQRETVKNERGQRYDNRPYGLVFEKISQALYPEGHPYSWTTIGYIEDLNRVNVNDLKKFFLRWYGPNNATLTIGGDIDKDQTLQWVRRYFSDIPRGPEVVKVDIDAVTLDNNRYISYEDNINLPLLYLSFPTVYLRHPDEAALDVLSNILGEGESSIFYKNLVKNGLAVNAGASHPCSELSCTFNIFALPNPGISNELSRMEDVIRQSLLEFEQRGVNDDDLARVKGLIISSMVYGLESVSGKVSQLANYETFTGNPNYVQEDIERYNNITKEDVMRVFEQYIKNSPAVILSVVPKGQLQLVANTDTFIYQDRTLPEYETTNAEDLELRVAKSHFDRSVIPAAGANPSLKAPDVWRATLDNGIQVVGSVNSEVPTTAMKINFSIGQRYENLDQLGLAALTAAMLNESTQLSSNEEVSNRLQQMGSSVSISSEDFYTVTSIKSLTDNLMDTLNLASEHLLKPKFDSQEFGKVKDQIIQSIEANKKEASVTANQVMHQLLFGNNNSFAFPDSGSIESVEKLQLQDVKQFYNRHYHPDKAWVMVVSSLPKEAILERLNWLGNWQTNTESPPEPAIAKFPDIEPSTLYFIDKPNAAQSEIRIFKQALPYDALGEYYRADLMNYALGEAFNSRINLNLREDKGYTYGARGYFIGTKQYGYYVARSGVRSNVTLESLQEILKELSQYHATGPVKEEWLFTQNSIGQRDARAFETPSQKLDFLDKIYRYQLEPDFIEQQQDILNNMSLEGAAKLASKYLDPASMGVLIVGDKQTVLPKLQSLDYTIVELDSEGNRL